MRIRQFPFNQSPHALVRGLRQRLVVFHGNHILGVRGLFSRGQPCLQLLGERKVLLCGPCRQFFGNHGFPITNYRIVADMDNFLLEVDIFPLESKNFSPLHPCVEGCQQKRPCLCVLYPLQEALGFRRCGGDDRSEERITAVSMATRRLLFAKLVTQFLLHTQVQSIKAYQQRAVAGTPEIP